MVQIFDKTNILIDYLLKVNSNYVKEISNARLDKFPISYCYYLTLLDISTNTNIMRLFEYINDDTRMVPYPFIKNNQIDYSLMLEPEQFYNIELNETNNIKNILSNIDKFIDIVKESNGKIIFVIDIEYLINFMEKMEKKSIPNYLIDLIMFKLSQLSNILNVCILDEHSIITNDKNLLYLQLSKCANNLHIDCDYKNLLINKKIMVYIDINEFENEKINKVYWNVIKTDTQITEHISKIKSPFDDSYFNLMIVEGKTCFVKKISVIECIDKNIFNLDKNPGITINPLLRLMI